MERKNNEKKNRPSVKPVGSIPTFKGRKNSLFPIRHFVSGSCKTNGNISPVP